MCDSRHPANGAGSGPTERIAEMLVQHKPEAVSVLVIGTLDDDVAAIVAPLLAKRLYPDRKFGRTLHVEWVGGAQPGFQCAVAIK